MTAKRPTRSITKCRTCGHPKFEHTARIDGRNRNGCRFKGCYCPGFVLARKITRQPRQVHTVRYDTERMFDL